MNEFDILLQKVMLRYVITYISYDNGTYLVAVMNKNDYKNIEERLDAKQEHYVNNSIINIFNELLVE